MIQTPKSLRLQIGIFGRTNVGKSSLLNMIANQDVALTSPIPGTTTDVVEKSLELLPIGPVTFLDTAGVDDTSALAEKRIERTEKVFERGDVFIIVLEPNIWTEFEEKIALKLESLNKPYIFVINKIDSETPNVDFIKTFKKFKASVVQCSAVDIANRDEYIIELKGELIRTVPGEFLNPAPLLSDLVSPGGIAIFIVPIDLQAPKGRLILPQVQAIRETLDSDAISIVVKEREYQYLLQKLKLKPDIVVCDSQVVQKMIADTPPDIKCTTFSILFARYKGDLVEEVKGAAAIDRLKKGDKVLIAESCSHHPLEDDIGRVKIPRWLRQYIGFDVQIDFFAGRDYPSNIKDYSVIIHCGGCMLTRNEKLFRIQRAKEVRVPITNYGLTISLAQGVLKRALSPFPSALEALEL